MRHPRILIAGSVAVLAAAAGVTYVFASDSGNGSARVAGFSDSGVTVTIAVKDRSAQHATLAATFTPDRPGFHLYSIDLPPQGIQGVGRPTSLTAQGLLAAAGPLTAEAAPTTLALAGTDLTLPVYPDGPVTVDLPVAIDGQGQATLLLGYAACSASSCLPPVSGHAVRLTVGAGAISALSSTPTSRG